MLALTNIINNKMTKLDSHVRSKIKLEYEVMHGYAYVEDINTLYLPVHIGMLNRNDTLADKIRSTLGS